MTAFDMHEALKARQVKGSSAAVCELDRGMKELKVNRINNFSAFHNFSYENEGLRLSKVYGVGAGRLIPWSELVIEKQGNLLLKEVDNYGVFAIDRPATILKARMKTRHFNAKNLDAIVNFLLQKNSKITFISGGTRQQHQKACTMD